MSETDHLNKGSDVPTPDEAVNVTSPTADSPSDAALAPADSNANWQTVNFPGALSIDAIPVAADAAPKSADSPQPTDLTADLTQRLQQENLELRDRLMQLERDLSQQQIEFQLELSRALYSTSHSASQGTPESNSQTPQVTEISAAQTRLNQLSQELAVSQQTVQRQQILVETLSGQLDSGQERIAQLERDCALAQQRYNEKIQQLMQAENVCRDLRTRLHRQQRQTLQFKAALERCLEMPSSQGQPHLIDPESGVAAPVIAVPPVSLAQVMTPKNQPVRPWSAMAGQDSDEAGDSTGDRLTPLAKIIKIRSTDEASEGAAAIAATPAPENRPKEEQSADWINQIFDDGSEPQIYHPVPGSDAANDIFDLSSFLDADGNAVMADSAAPDAIAETEPLASSYRSDDSLLQMLASVPLDSDEIASPLETFRWGQSSQDDPLWDDLAKLIDASASSNSPANHSPANHSSVNHSSAKAVSFLGSPPGQSEAKDDQPTNSPVPTFTPEHRSEGTPAVKATVSFNKKPLELVTWGAGSATSTNQPSQPAAISIERLTEVSNSAPTPPFAVVTSGKKAAQPGEDGTANAELLSGGSPSPVVYPLRPSKKLKSLAAVDLPMFPRAK